MTKTVPLAMSAQEARDLVAAQSARIAALEKALDRIARRSIDNWAVKDAHDALSAAPQDGDLSDTQLLDSLAANYWDLKCVDVPTGGDDVDVDWVVVEHHMGEKGNVTIAQSHCDDPRAALRAALKA